MCGIAGGEDAEKLIEAMSHRGSSSCEDSGRFKLAHRLHSIVGDVDQPLEGDGKLVANCEIYNWEQLAEEHGFEARNDAELLLKMLDKYGTGALEKLDGVYAFAYEREGELIIARDRLGVKPIWYMEEPFAFASEKQALEKTVGTPRQLHPRKILRYDIKEDSRKFEQREFFETDEVDEEIDKIAEEIKDRFLEAVDKRTPDQEVALLLSGGVDSTMVAAALKQLNADFTCYTSSIQHGNVSRARDQNWAEEIAEEMDLELQSYESDLEEVENLLPQLADWISSTSTVKLGVVLPFHFALQNADEKVVMSGLGSEQLYAGYDRQEGYLNRECLSGLRKIWHRDLYRDDVVTMRNRTELRVPFLDQNLIEHALSIPGEMKVRDDFRKYVLRMAAEKLGVPEKVAWRKKTAAQYGSNFDKAISRLAKDNGYESKQNYLNSLRDKPNHWLAALSSGGKDSNAAMYRMIRRNSSIRCLVTLDSENEDSYMFDTELSGVSEQAEKLGIPLIRKGTEGQKEQELGDLEEALQTARERHNVEGVVAGALASTYQRDWVEKIAEKVGLKVFAPLWSQDSESYMKWLIGEGFGVKIVDVAARGLEDDWIGTELDQESLEDLLSLSRDYGFHAAGEGGEYETEITEFPDKMLAKLEN